MTNDEIAKRFVFDLKFKLKDINYNLTHFCTPEIERLRHFTSFLNSIGYKEDMELSSENVGENSCDIYFIVVATNNTKYCLKTLSRSKVDFKYVGCMYEIPHYIDDFVVEGDVVSNDQ